MLEESWWVLVLTFYKYAKWLVFPVWFLNLLISSGLETVQSNNQKWCVVLYQYWIDFPLIKKKKIKN